MKEMMQRIMKFITFDSPYKPILSALSLPAYMLPNKANCHYGMLTQPVTR